MTKTKEYAIKYLHQYAKKSIQEIAEELKISQSEVKKIVGADNNKISKSKTDKTKDLMIRQTSAKKNNSVSIMTESASQLSDEFIKNMNNKSSKNSDHIFRPRNS